jgi:hypothetical protein
MKLCASGLMVAALVLSHGAPTFAASKVQTSLTAVDNGKFTFLSQTSASVAGDGFEKQGFELNRKVGSSGQFDLLGPADRCADGSPVDWLACSKGWLTSSKPNTNACCSGPLLTRTSTGTRAAVRRFGRVDNPA